MTFYHLLEVIGTPTGQRDRGGLIGLRRRRLLADHQALPAALGGEQVQRLDTLVAVIGAAGGLAIHRDDIEIGCFGIARAQAADPAAKQARKAAGSSAATGSPSVSWTLTKFQQAMKEVLGQVSVDIVERSDRAKQFIVLPKR